ncbi:alpha/beta fold hydrolase [Rhizobium sp. CG5]|uniref:serine aminopeptidase domain-containing protein n=1 Tax=Rhizobium sp. CG5 TaxID=2726076 RepID=UPI002033FE64|nr:alpha/beta fold hydrolase [Rhizobium sp. CG5]
MENRSAPGQAGHVERMRRGAPTSTAIPVVFSQTIGLFMPAQAPMMRDVAVLFASPWGIEEMCTHKFWRVIAERLAAVGVSSLRFDYPGTGDAGDGDEFQAGLSTWEDSLVGAAEQLRRLSGCRRIIVVSQGLGAAIATNAAGRLGELAGMAFLAPAISGRFYLRELQFWARAIDDGMGLAAAHRSSGGVAIASLRMPEPIAADVRKLDLMAVAAAPCSPCLVIERPDRPAESGFADRLETLGATVTRASYTGYDALVANPTMAKMPLAVARTLVDWVVDLPAGQPVSTAETITDPQYLSGDGYRETPLTFGQSQRLYGVLCEPLGKRQGATVLLLSTAYDRHAGWGRTTVTMARDLACEGIASLRFDPANVGDSPPVAGLAEQVLYTETQVADVVEALDLVDERGLLPAIVVGRCSGAYLAFRSALRDPRIRGVVVANPFAFFWNPKRNVDEFLSVVPRSLDTYKARLFQRDTLRRLLDGRIDVRVAFSNMVKALGQRLLQATGAGPYLLPEQRRNGREVKSAFVKLAARGTELRILYSEHDIGLTHFASHFGADGEGLKRYPNARMAMIEDTDHNLTPEKARRVYYEAIREMAMAQSPKW